MKYDDNQKKIVVEALRHTEDRLNGLNGFAASAETKTMQFAALNTVLATVVVVNAEKFPYPAFVLASSIALGSGCIDFRCAVWFTALKTER